jgi:hypothetical protein
MPATVSLFLIVMFTGFFAMVFGIYYLASRQNMAMIEKGMNPKETIRKPFPRYLKWALLLVGAGLGLLLAYFLDTFLFQTRDNFHNDNPAIYFALIAIGGGLGLFRSYQIEKNEISRVNNL